jgi:hypothetical protein
MSDSMNEIASQSKTNEIDALMVDKIDIYSKIINFVKKSNAYVAATIFQMENNQIKFDSDNFRKFALIGKI